MKSPDRTSLVEELQTYLHDRDIDKGFQALDLVFAQRQSLFAGLPQEIALLFSMAQWIDLGYVVNPSFETMMTAFSEVDQTKLLLEEFLQLRMVQAFCCMTSMQYDKAIFLLETTLGPGENLMSTYQQFVGHFWLGRACRLAGDFVKSLPHFRAARALADRIHAPRLSAVSKIHESWLVFHNGKRHEALTLLDEAEAELRPTGHALSLGNIAAARGRFLRGAGQYGEALLQFEKAIAIYKESHRNHTNLARAYVNAAYVKRLMALDVLPTVRGTPASAEKNKLALRITSEALLLLASASQIYVHHQHQGGVGSILINTGYLHLETGDIERAGQEADNAFILGERRSDVVLKARASALQALVELALCEEQVEDETDSRAHLAMATDHAERAVTLAGHTQNRRLQAAAYIVRGLIATDDASLDLALARDHAARARQLLGKEDRDHLYRELGNLNARILRSSTVDETIQAWCMGDLGGKSFQEIQKRFAEIVIPRVWNRMDRKVSRVAKELSISPKKVRRLLRESKYL